jgi:hypothetical protein
MSIPPNVDPEQRRKDSQGPKGDTTVVVSEALLKNVIMEAERKVTSETRLLAMQSLQLEEEQLDHEQQLHFQSIRLRIDDARQNIDLRRQLSQQTLRIVKCWMSAVFVLLVFHGFEWPTQIGTPFGNLNLPSFTLSDSVIIAVLTTTTINVIGLLLTVTINLFPPRGSSK